jgi:hypothetical protein
MRRHIGSEYHIDASLLRIAPEIGTELRHSFAWLDDQLAIG